jgi:hypothetical protein
MSRLQVGGLVIILAGCVGDSEPSRAPATTPPTPSEPDLDQRLAELSPLYFYDTADDVHRPGRPDWHTTERPPRDGILVYERPGMRPLEPGDRLAVVHAGISHVVVTADRCPPDAADCLDCGSRWAVRVDGPRIDPDTAMVMVGPLTDDALELAAPFAEDVGLRVTADDVRLRRRWVCDGEFFLSRECVIVTEFVHGDATRELSRWTAALHSVPQIFSVMAWPGTTMLTQDGDVGGPNQVVIGEWTPAPEIPVEDASYWLVGRNGVVGSVRFDPPYNGSFCSFASDPCWATTAVQLPSPDESVVVVVGPVPASTMPMSASVTIGDNDSLDLIIGPPDSPWLTLTAKSFECRKEAPRRTGSGVCFETVITTAGVTRRRVTYLPTDMHHARSRTVCDEHTTGLMAPG